VQEEPSDSNFTPRVIEELEHQFRDDLVRQPSETFF